MVQVPTVLGDLAPLIPSGKRHALHALDQVGGVGRLLEQGGPDGLQGGLRSHHRQEPEAAGVRVEGKGVGSGRVASGGDGVEVLAVEDRFRGNHEVPPVGVDPERARGRESPREDTGEGMPVSVGWG